MFAWIKYQFLIRIRRRDLVWTFKDVCGFVLATDLNHMEDHVDLICSMQYGGDHFDDRLAMLHGICLHNFQAQNLTQAEYHNLVVLILKPEHQIAQIHGYTGDLPDLAAHLTRVMETARGRLLSLLISEILSNKIQRWDKHSADVVQHSLWRHAIDGIDREEQKQKRKVAEQTPT